jgi:hypothetical protein
MESGEEEIVKDSDEVKVRRSKAGLSPCPFCGGPAEVYEDAEIKEWFAECPKMTEDCPVFTFAGPFPSREEAVQAWNTRAKGER